jgi:LCP family protein required for cell wall assembly
MRKIFRHSVLFLALAALCTSCVLPGKVGKPASLALPTPTAGPVYILSVPGATATATPFQPVASTLVASSGFDPSQVYVQSTPQPQESEATQEPDVTPTLDVGMVYNPPQAPKLRIPPGVETLALLGTDEDPPNIGRTDTIVLVFLNQQNNQVSMVSIPRDLYVFIPGWTMGRVNSAYQFGGIDLTKETLEYNLGFRPDHYALAHLQVFSQFIDDIGGIDLVIQDEIIDPWCQVGTGQVHLGGYGALCYARSRMGDNDIKRNERQQDVLFAILQQCFSLKVLPRLPELYKKYSGSLQTDLSFADLVKMVPMALRIRSGTGLHRYQVNYDHVVEWVVPETGAMVLIPDRARIMPILEHAIQAVAQP